MTRPATTAMEAGYSLPELALLIAIVAITAALAMPSFLSYQRGATLRLAAEHVAAILNHGRQLAIVQNAAICVHSTPTALHYRQGTCAGPAWVGPSTDAGGGISMPPDIALTATAEPVFNYAGAATPGATYTITHTPTAAAVRVVLAPSGRVSIAP